MTVYELIMSTLCCLLIKVNLTQYHILIITNERRKQNMYKQNFYQFPTDMSKHVSS